MTDANKLRALADLLDKILRYRWLTKYAPELRAIAANLERLEEALAALGRKETTT